MCEFCHKHGEGKKWYLRAQNYSEDLLSDIKRARFIEDFFAHPEKIAKGDLKAEDLMKAPERVRKIMGKMITRSSMKEHFGQVVPIEDIKKILDITTSIVRLECICRRTSVGPEQRFCYGLSLMPRGGRLVEIVNRIDPAYLKGPNDSDLEIMSREKTLSVFMEYEKKGLCHTVWTFHTPFIGGLCNCNAKDCYAMRMTVGRRIPVMFKAEYIMSVDDNLCSGCRKCEKLCQFNALNYDFTRKKIVIEKENCFGCGICRSVCEKKALTLSSRR